MNNELIANLLNRYAGLLSLHGGNSFKVSAYKNAAFNINKKTPQNLSTLSEEELMELPQLGKGLSNKIYEIAQTGSFEELNDLLSQTPKGVVEMLSIRGLGPKKVQIIWKEMGIDSVGELLDACRQNRLAKTKGFGEKTQEQVLAAMEFAMANADQIHWAKGHKYALLIEGVLSQMLGEGDFEWVGDYKRKVEILKQLELLIKSNYKRALMIALSNVGLSLDQEQDGSYKGLIEEKFPIIIHFIEAEEFAWQTYSLTTPKDVQQKIGLLKNEAATEKQLFEQQNKTFIIPEIREHENIDWLLKAKETIAYEDLKGCIHNHTVYSDGLNSLKEMADACLAQGWQYFGVCDHSKTAGYANGMKEEAVLKQWAEIDKLNKGYQNFKIFKGIESDILADGSLDYEDEILKGFEIVVASIHSNLKMEQEKAMMRLIKAIENPYTRVLGHLTGRLLLIRDGYPIDHQKIIDACAANNVAIELNAHPYRLDMDWRYIHRAIEKGVLISINPDAHVTSGLLDMQYGIHAAKKGGLTAEMCLNAKSLEEFESWVQSK